MAEKMIEETVETTDNLENAENTLKKIGTLVNDSKVLD